MIKVSVVLIYVNTKSIASYNVSKYILPNRYVGKKKDRSIHLIFVNVISHDKFWDKYRANFNSYDDSVVKKNAYLTKKQTFASFTHNFKNYKLRTKSSSFTSCSRCISQGWTSNFLF